MAGSSSLFVSFPPAIRYKSAQRTSSPASGFSLLSGAFRQRISFGLLFLSTRCGGEDTTYYAAQAKHACASGGDSWIEF